MVSKKTVLEKYSRYYDYLEKISRYPLAANPSVRELEIPQSLLQSGYKEMKEIAFEGNIIDYMCYVSMEYLLSEWDKDISDKNKLERQALLLPTELKNMIITPEVKPVLKAPVVALIKLIEVLRKNMSDTRNVLRIFYRFPKYFLESETCSYFFESFNDEELRGEILQIEVANVSLLHIKTYYIFRTINAMQFFAYVIEGSPTENKDLVWNAFSPFVLTDILPTVKINPELIYFDATEADNEINLEE